MSFREKTEDKELGVERYIFVITDNIFLRSFKESVTSLSTDYH